MISTLKGHVVKVGKSTLNTASKIAWDGTICALAGCAVTACCGLIIAGKAGELTCKMTTTTTTCASNAALLSKDLAATAAGLCLAPAKFAATEIRKGYREVRPAEEVSEPSGQHHAAC